MVWRLALLVEKLTRWVRVLISLLNLILLLLSLLAVLSRAEEMERNNDHRATTRRSNKRSNIGRPAPDIEREFPGAIKWWENNIVIAPS
jgi:hypothetical protein